MSTTLFGSSESAAMQRFSSTITTFKLFIHKVSAIMHIQSRPFYLLTNEQCSSLVIFLFCYGSIAGHQSTQFNSMSNIQIGGKIARNGRFRIERPFVGVIAGLSVNRLRPLDLAAERDPHVTVRGDVQLVTGVLDRNDLQKMQQVRKSTTNHTEHNKASQKYIQTSMMNKNQNEMKKRKTEKFQCLPIFPIHFFFTACE